MANLCERFWKMCMDRFFNFDGLGARTCMWLRIKQVHSALTHTYERQSSGGTVYVLPEEAEILYSTYYDYI